MRGHNSTHNTQDPLGGKTTSCPSRPTGTGQGYSAIPSEGPAAADEGHRISWALSPPQAQPSGLNTFPSCCRSHTLRGHGPPRPTPLQVGPKPPLLALPRLLSGASFASSPAGGAGDLHLVFSLKELGDARPGWATTMKTPQPPILNTGWFQSLQNIFCPFP